MERWRSRWTDGCSVAWLVVLVFAGTTHAQDHGCGTASLDRRLLCAVYEQEGGSFEAWMRGAHLSAYPIFLGAPVAAWGHVWLQDGSREDAYLLTVSEIGAAAGFVAVKMLVRRPRPYEALPEIQSRARRYGRDRAVRDRYSFPSGHAALSFALATSWSLSHPEWYVAGPAFAWAGSVAVSRVWLGIHYPSDALAGAALGSGMAVLVHALRDRITPERWKDSAVPVDMPVFTLRLRLP